jgi:hypothetical protein
MPVLLVCLSPCLPHSKYLQKGISLEALLAEYSPESSEEVSQCCDAAAADCSDDEGYHGGAASSQNSEVTPHTALDLPEVTGGLLLAEDPRDEIQHLLADLSDAITGYEEQAAMGGAPLWENAHLVGLDLDLSEAAADASAPLHDALPQEPASAGAAPSDTILVMQRAQLVSLQQGLLGGGTGSGGAVAVKPAADRQQHTLSPPLTMW